MTPVTIHEKFPADAGRFIKILSVSYALYLSTIGASQNMKVAENTKIGLTMISPPLLRFHIGAHKTATTYIQELLQTNLDLIQANATVYWPLAETRAVISHELASLRASKFERLKALLLGEKGKAWDSATQSFEQLLSHDHTTLLSEENILGGTSSVLNGRFYPEAAKNFKTLTSDISDRPMEIWLAIRSYPEFISSAYAESLRQGYFAPTETVVKKFAGFEMGWRNLILSLSEVRPDAKFVVWRFENFRALEDVLISRLVDLEYSKLQSIGRGLVRPSASTAAIQAMISQGPNHRWFQRKEIMRDLEKQYPENKNIPSEKFSLFNHEDTLWLKDAYERDCQAIEQLDMVDFVKLA